MPQVRPLELTQQLPVLPDFWVDRRKTSTERRLHFSRTNSLSGKGGLFINFSFDDFVKISCRGAAPSSN